MRDNKGMTMIAALIVTGVMAATVLGIAKMIDFNAHQNVYFSALNQTNSVAQDGLNAALASLVVNPDPTKVPAGWRKALNQSGEYRNTVQVRAKPVNPSYYVITDARKTIAGNEYKTRLHSYVRVSNIGEYFAAVNSELTISAGANIAGGKIYAPRLTFSVEPGNKTTVGCAEFVDDPSRPDELQPPLVDGNWSQSIKDNFIDIDSGCTPNKVPVALKVPLLFPQIFKSDMDNWQELANEHTTKNIFTGDIYPPGYEDAGTCPANDDYAHTGSNADHVYFVSGDLFIRGRVHGQILFVATGDIHITGDLVKAPDDDCLPGAGEFRASSSTAHQAVLITPNKVVIDKDAFFGVGNTESRVVSATAEEKIQAMIMAPNASFDAKPYDDIVNHERLGLNVNGSLILSEIGGSFPIIFKRSRIYSYDTSFRDNPPPYLPALTEIFYTIEENVSETGLYAQR